MKRELITDAALVAAMAALDGWAVEEKMLKKRYSFENFAGSLAFVNKVGELAEAADHHPDITFGWGYAEVALTTHDRGGVTDVDIALAQKIDSL
jgi:4a-hydroxytetrahydrobiopterin dehydratase